MVASKLLESKPSSKTHLDAVVALVLCLTNGSLDKAHQLTRPGSVADSSNFCKRQNCLSDLSLHSNLVLEVVTSALSRHG